MMDSMSRTSHYVVVFKLDRRTLVAPGKVAMEQQIPRRNSSIQPYTIQWQLFRALPPSSKGPKLKMFPSIVGDIDPNADTFPRL